MRTSRPAVAVLVPTFNGARFVAETLSAIQTQTHANLRVLIRDDGSTDETIDIAGHFAANDPRFQLVPGGDRRGATRNYLALLEHVDETFIKMVNQDDLIDRRCIEKLLAPMLKNSEITLSASARGLIDSAGEQLPDPTWAAPLADERGLLNGRAVIANTLAANWNQIGEPSTVLIRNGAIGDERPFTYGGHEFDILSDIAFWLTLASYGPMYYSPERLSSFRRHSSQISSAASTPVRGTIEWATMVDRGYRLGHLPTLHLARVAAQATLAGVQAAHVTISAQAPALDEFRTPLAEAESQLVSLLERIAPAQIAQNTYA